MKKTDIHLHCKEWDDAFDEGDWEPEQIVAKLPWPHMKRLLETNFSQKQLKSRTKSMIRIEINN